MLLKRLGLAACAVSLALAATTGGIDASRYLDTVKRLSSEEMKGRGTGTPGLDKAAAYISKEFRAAGLQPIGAKGFLLPFPVTTRARLADGNRFEYLLNGTSVQLKLSQDFAPLSFSGSGTVTAPVVFAGYGITAPEYGYDDYAGLAAEGKIVLILRHEPQEYDDKSVFSGRVYTEHAQFFSKAVNARAHGAAGVVMIHDQANHSPNSEQLEAFIETVGPAEAEIPFVQVKASVAEEWVNAAGMSLGEIQAQIDRKLRPKSFPFPDHLRVSIESRVERTMKNVFNVAGFLPGSTSEYIIVGAHYDHLGLGEQYSMSAADAGKAIHPGADDNASGAAGVVELARTMARRPQSRRGVLFLCFAGEELGLLGSSFYGGRPALPLADAVAMINMDMIGRARDRKVYVGGTSTGSGLRARIERIAARYPFELDLTDSVGYGSSDHTSFTARQVPALFFFTGLHGDYHRPTDTWDKIDAPATSQLLSLIGEVAAELREDQHRPRFVPSKVPADSTR
jgi:hypothetical protein